LEPDATRDGYAGGGLRNITSGTAAPRRSTVYAEPSSISSLALESPRFVRVESGVVHTGYSTDPPRLLQTARTRDPA